MAKTLNIIQGVVKYAAGPARETKNGPRINVVITLPSGEDIKLWGDPGDAVLTPLRKGNPVQLIEKPSGKGYSILDSSPAATTIPQAKSSALGNSPRQQETWRPWTEQEKKELAAQVE
jgi:hypothetical protein